MGYGTESKQVLWMNDHGTDAVKNTTKVVRLLDSYTILRIMALVIAAPDADMTITVTRRVTPGSDTNAVSVGTLTVPNGTAIGKMVYKDITPQDANVGDELKFAVSNTGTAGSFQLGALVLARPEVPGNQSDMVASS